MFPAIAWVGDSQVNIRRFGTGTPSRRLVRNAKSRLLSQPGFDIYCTSGTRKNREDGADQKQRLPHLTRQPHGVGTQRRTTHPPP